MEIAEKACKKYRQFLSGRNFKEYKLIRNEVNEIIRGDEDTNRNKIIQGFIGHVRSTNS